MKMHQQAIKEKPSAVQESSKTGTAVQCKGYEARINYPQPPVQRQPDETGLPENLKEGVEDLSGYSMDDVKVNYNSTKPASLNALAYAQGTDIHIAPGQEKHLPHEAWHVVQQKQGRVQPTIHTKEGGINDDITLEKEADILGERIKAVSSLNGETEEKPPQGKTESVQYMDGQGEEKPIHGEFARKDRPASSTKSKLSALRSSAIAGYITAPVQRAAKYKGTAINTKKGAWGAKNLIIDNLFKYNPPTAQNTASMAYAKRIDGDWIGVGVNSFPVHWAKFTQLVGPYAIRNLVQGHMINQRMGGNGNAENLAPITTSANSKHWSSVESPIKTWLDADSRNIVDYKITPHYHKATPALKKRLTDEFKITHKAGTTGTNVARRKWVGDYIDDNIPSAINIEVNFMQARHPWPYAPNQKARQKPLIKATVHNKENATFNVTTGGSISGYSGIYSAFNLNINDTIDYGPVNAQNSGTRGHADRISNIHAGSTVNSEPTDWTKFTRLVGPDAVGYIVQGHLINQKIGGQGINTNLTPLTTSANSLHETKMESPIKSWLKKPAAKGYGPYLVDYSVKPKYGGADPALKVSLLKSYDDTNSEITGATQLNLLAWLNNYIDATFPERLDVSVSFMESDQYSPRNLHARARTKPALTGYITNEP